MSVSRSVRKVGRARRPISLEALENRQLLTTFLVVNNGDSGNGTLRQAITSADATAGSNTIQFNLPASELTITPLTALPAITNTGTVLDATSTQVGYAGTPLVAINGSKLAGNTNSLIVTGGGTTIRGLIIEDFPGAGITLSGSAGDVVQNCYIGVDPTGEKAAPNALDGIFITNSNNTIGGTTALTRNVISGNTQEGILLNGSTAAGNVVEGNYIGVGADGRTAVGNGFEGIFDGGGADNLFGGIVPGTGNIISANDAGIALYAAGPHQATVEGNYIGTDSTGTIAVPNINDGIDVLGAGQNIIGATGGVGAGGNLISGNGGIGISLLDATSMGTVIIGNAIGTNAAGTTAIGNSLEGILDNGGNNLLIGGETPGNGNIIAYNGSMSKNYGVNLTSGTGVAIQGNSIYANLGGGIFLSPGTNGDQVSPTITTAQTAGSNTEIIGSLVSASLSTFTIEFFSNPATDPSGFLQGKTYLGSVQVTTDSSGTATFDARVPVGTTIGGAITATATQGRGVQNTSEFSAPVTIVAAPVSNLAVSIAANPTGSVLLGQPETYTVTVKNNGPNTATNVVLVNTIDNNSSYVSSTTSTGAKTVVNGPTITASFASLANGASLTVTITVMPVATTAPITLTSVVSATQLDSAPANETATISLPVQPSADLSLVLNADSAVVPVGGNLTYTLTVIDLGPSTATGTVVTDTLPAGVTLVSAADAGGAQYTQSGNTITFPIGDLGTGSPDNITIVVSPNQSGSITNTASVSSPVADPVSSNNTATVTTTVANASDLALTVTPSTPFALAGVPLSYTLTVVNLGPSIATGAVLTDILPPGYLNLQYSASNGGVASVAGGVLTVALPTLAPNGSATVTVNVTFPFSQTITNLAAVNFPTSIGEVDPNLANNAATTITNVSPADLSIALSANPVVATIGQVLAYTVTVTNNGPTAATGVNIADLIPASATFVNATGAYTNTGGVIRETIGDLPSGGTATIFILVTPTLGGLIADDAGVASFNVDPNPANNVASVSTPVSPADLTLTGSASTQTPQDGDPLVFTYVVTNNGPAVANNAYIQFAVPSNSTYASATTSVGFTGVANGIAVAAFGNLAPGASAVVNFTVLPTAIGSVVANAAATSSSYDPNTANNSSSIAVAATNSPGTFQLSSGSYFVAENAGQVAITITRTNGTLGAVSVNYATVDGTAKSGINYTGINSAIQFAAGQTSATITIPVRDDGAITPNLTFFFAITGLGAGAISGGVTTATVTVVNVDRDFVPPTILSVLPLESGSQIAGFQVLFSKALDATSAGNLANYLLLDNGNGNRVVPIAAALYNPANNIVTLIPSTPLSLNHFYGVIVNGASATGVKDLSGNLLSGLANGVGGSNYGEYVGIGNNLGYADLAGNFVDLTLSSGQLLIDRSLNGEATEVQLLGYRAGSTVLGGSVTRVGGSSGSTLIPRLVGLGAFGSVRSTLTSPPFFVLAQSFIAPLPIPQIGASTPTR